MNAPPPKRVPTCPKCHSSHLIRLARGRGDATTWKEYYWIQCGNCGAEVGIEDKQAIS